MLLSLIRMVQAFRDYQRNVTELSQLSDRELADIGLDRSDIPRVAAGQLQRLISSAIRRTDIARLAAGVVVSASETRSGDSPARETRYLSAHDRIPISSEHMHIIGAGLAGSRPPGSSPNGRAASFCTRCARTG